VLTTASKELDSSLPTLDKEMANMPAEPVVLATAPVAATAEPVEEEMKQTSGAQQTK